MKGWRRERRVRPTPAPAATADGDPERVAVDLARAEREAQRAREAREAARRHLAEAQALDPVVDALSTKSRHRRRANHLAEIVEAALRGERTR